MVHETEKHPPMAGSRTRKAFNLTKIAGKLDLHAFFAIQVVRSISHDRDAPLFLLLAPHRMFTSRINRAVAFSLLTLALDTGLTPEKCFGVEAQPETVECVLRLSEHASLPAERNGVVKTVHCHVGTAFEANQLITSLKVKKAELEKKKLLAELNGLALARENYALKAKFDEIVKEKKFELKQLRLFEEGFPLPELEKVRVVSQMNQAKADSENATTERLQAESEYEAKLAEVELAEIAIQVSEIRAPFAGVVTKVLRQPREWVEEGDALVEIARMDNLEVVFKIPFELHHPSQLVGTSFQLRLIDRKRVVVHEAILEIERVQMLTDSTGLYLAFAELPNVRVPGTKNTRSWLLMPGLTGEAIPVPHVTEPPQVAAP